MASVNTIWRCEYWVYAGNHYYVFSCTLINPTCWLMTQTICRVQSPAGLIKKTQLEKQLFVPLYVLKGYHFPLMQSTKRPNKIGNCSKTTSQYEAKKQSNASRFCCDWLKDSSHLKQYIAVSHTRWLFRQSFTKNLTHYEVIYRSSPWWLSETGNSISLSSLMNIVLLAGTKSNTAFNMTREVEESMDYGITFLGINSWYKRVTC